MPLIRIYMYNHRKITFDRAIVVYVKTMPLIRTYMYDSGKNALKRADV